MSIDNFHNTPQVFLSPVKNKKKILKRRRIPVHPSSTSNPAVEPESSAGLSNSESGP